MQQSSKWMEKTMGTHVSFIFSGYFIHISRAKDPDSSGFRGPKVRYVRCIRGPVLRNQCNIQTHMIWLIFMVNVRHKYSSPTDAVGKFTNFKAGQ